MAGWSIIHETDPLLHQAAYVGDLRKLGSLLALATHKKQLNKKNWYGCTPLRLAATAGKISCIDHLLGHGADINLPDVKAQTPLFVAVKNRHIDCVRLLLQNSADPNGDEGCLCTPLYVAAMDGFIEGVQELTKYGADIDRSQIKMDSFISTPLYISIAYHHFDCFRHLLISGADPDFNCRMNTQKRHQPSCQSLFHAVVRHSVEVDYVKLLWEFGASLYNRDDKGKLAWELDKTTECTEFLREMHDKPRSLKSRCRIVIRKAVSRERLKKLNTLPLPTKLVSYLQHDDIS